MSLIGLIGMGKSMLINILLDLSVQETTGTRDYYGKGRHKTTVCQIFVLPGGALMTDNLGLREVGIGTAGTGISEAFPEIFEPAGGCRFSDCRHEPEPGCAVRRGIFLIGPGALNLAAVVA